MQVDASMKWRVMLKCKKFLNCQLKMPQISIVHSAMPEYNN